MFLSQIHALLSVIIFLDLEVEIQGNCLDIYNKLVADGCGEARVRCFAPVCLYRLIAT